MFKLKFNTPLVIIILVSLAVKVYISFGTGLPWITVDSVNYIHQAEVLLSGGYAYYFPNGYPLIIAFFILTSSVISFKVGLILFNIFISLLSVFFIYHISVKFLTERIYALFAAAIVALYPNQLNYVRFILSEVPAAFFLILSLYLFISNRKILSGLSIGFASTIRTTLLPVSVFFIIYLMYKKMYREGILFLIYSLIPVFTFFLYGYLKTGDFTLFVDVPRVFYISLGLENVPADIFEGLKVYVGYMVKHPVNFFLDRLSSLWDLWGFIPESNEGFRANLFFRLLIGLRFPVLLFALYGFIKSVKNSLTIYLIIPAVVITSIHALIITSAHESFIANPRYIFPAEPFLVILAVKAVNIIYSRAKVN